MAECPFSFFRNMDLNASLRTELHDIMKKSRSIKGPLTRYILNTTVLNNDEYLRKEQFGINDKKKPHKSILLVGETGVGKSTLINAMVNYLLGVTPDDRIWFEIIETKDQQFNSQTVVVTVYDVFLKESPISLTIIDSPGFGSTDGKEEEDSKLIEMIHELFRSTDGIMELSAVGLVVTSETNRLTEHQRYVFDGVLSLFGSDVEKNIVVFVTHSPRKPRNAIEAIKRSEIPCAKNDKGEPVYFTFDNFHCENPDEDMLDDYETAWNVLSKSMKNILNFMNDSKNVSLKMSLTVLRRRKQLAASISNLKDRITVAEIKKTNLEQLKEALQRQETKKTKMNNFELDVVEVYKDLVPIKSKGKKKATCCTVCQENCHYPGCWWVRSLYWCSVMKDGKCTVCTGKCDHSKHEKLNQIYELKTRTVKKTLEDLKIKYETNFKHYTFLITRLENEIKELDAERIRLVEECYQCVITLEEIALHSVSESTLQHLDFLIERVEEMRITERVQKLKDLKKYAMGEKLKTPTFRP